MTNIETACRTLADNAFRVFQNADQIARKVTDDPDDIGALLYAIGDLKEAVKEAEEPLRKHCKGASK